MTIDVGDKAPDFSAPTDSGGTASLKALKVRKVVLYFYPKEDTPSCTMEASGYSDALPAFLKAGAEIIGMSKDSFARHDKFKAKYELPFTLMADGKRRAVRSR